MSEVRKEILGGQTDLLAGRFIHRSWFLIASIICCAIKGVKASMILSALSLFIKNRCNTE